MDVSTGKGPTVVSEIPSDFVAELVPRKVHVLHVCFVGVQILGLGLYLNVFDVCDSFCLKERIQEFEHPVLMTLDSTLIRPTEKM